jgi:hypothetical protein
MPTNYPTTYDDNTSMPSKADGEVIYAADNNTQVDAIKALEALVGKTGMRPLFANLPPFNADPASADNGTAFQAIHDALPADGGDVAIMPGRYKCLTGILAYDKPSVRWLGLGGKHYQGTGTTASPVSTGGVILEGWTPGMTVIKCDRPGGNTNATHQGPMFENIGIQDGRSVASRRDVTAVALVSGTTYRYTTGAAHPFVATDAVFVNGVWNSTDPYGNAFDGHKTVTNVPDTTHFDVNIGSNPSLSGLTFSTADVRYAPSMTLLDIEHETRARLHDCHLHGGLYGVKFQGGNDVSWSNLTGTGLSMNDYGMFFSGDQAQSVSVIGGDFQVANGQIGIDYVGSKAMFKARDFKMDTVYNDGQGSIGIRLQAASSFMIDGSFEMDGPARPIVVGTTANAFGRISGSFQQNNSGPRSSRLGTGVDINGAASGSGTQLGNDSTNSTGVTQVSLVGSTFNGYGKAVNVGPYSRGVTIMGGSTGLCDIGCNVEAGASGTTLAFFKRRRVDTGGSESTLAANHIVDAGTGTQRIFCDNVTAPGGIVPAAGSTGMTSGFVHIPSGAGPPTTAPTTLYAGTVALYYDTTNHKLYIYDSGWKTQSAVFA